MYIEYKGDGLCGPARIGLVRFSKSGRTLYYDGRSFASLDGHGYKANYIDTQTNEHYWISGPRRDGNDSLYPAVVEIDEDVRERYWAEIRSRPDLSAEVLFRSPGKHSRKQPHPDLNTRGRSRNGGDRQAG